VKRLVHPTAALIRVLQMSNTDIIVFVEGWSDRFFYDRLVNTSCSASGLKYQIRTAKEIGANANGKVALIALFNAFKHRGVLDGSKKQRTSAFFFLDKDIDELKNLIINSRHIGYTEHFNVENYYIIAGDLPLATAASAALEVDALRQWFGDLDAWRRSAAEAWKTWVELCLFATLHGVACSCHFRSNSTVHKGSGQLDETRYATALDELKRAAGLTTTEFKRRHKQIRATVKGYYASGQHDALFNGKWYRIFIHAAVKTYSQGREFRENLTRSINDSLILTIQFDGKWSDGLRRPINRLIRHIKKYR